MGVVILIENLLKIIIIRVEHLVIDYLSIFT